MSRGSAFARVIGLTRSFSPQRNEEEAEPAETASGAVEEGFAGTLIGFPLERLAAAPAAAEMAYEAAPLAVATTQELTSIAPDIAMALETVVPTEAAPLPEAPPDEHAARLTALPDTITDAAISSIEDDIASILATLERQDFEAAAAAAAASDGAWLEDEQADDADDAVSDEQVSTLLSELNRLWVSDPAVAAHRTP